jgi:hypothetical protein
MEWRPAALSSARVRIAFGPNVLAVDLRFLFSGHTAVFPQLQSMHRQHRPKLRAEITPRMMLRLRSDVANGRFRLAHADRKRTESFLPRESLHVLVVEEPRRVRFNLLDRLRYADRSRKADKYMDVIAHATDGVGLDPKPVADSVNHRPELIEEVFGNCVAVFFHSEDNVNAIGNIRMQGHAIGSPTDSETSNRVDSIFMPYVFPSWDIEQTKCRSGVIVFRLIGSIKTERESRRDDFP